MPIKFYYDTDDNTLESVNTGGIVLTQGQANSVEFHFYFKNYDTLATFTLNQMLQKSCLLNIERPDGSASNNIVSTPVVDDGDYYYKLVVSDWITEHDGVVQITAKLYDTVNETTTTFGTATLNIVASASVSQDTIEDAQYQALLSYLATQGNAKIQVRASGTIDTLDLVMFVGTVGSSGKLLVSKATQTVIKENPEYKFGIALTSATNNQDFYVQTVGVIDEIDTSGFTEGSILVPSATVAGGLIESTNANAPQAPLNRTPIAAVIYSHANHGILYVRPTIFPKMSQVKDVYIDNSQLTQGQGLVWNNTNNRFEAGFSGGVFYDDNLPAEADRFDNLTYFDED